MAPVGPEAALTTDLFPFVSEIFPSLSRMLNGMTRRPFGNQIIPLMYYLAPALIISFTTSSHYYDFMMTSMDRNNMDPLHYETYDFIVVGAGSAGAVVANRLSRHNKVLLLEAGGNPHPLSLVPIAQAILLNQPPIDWLYKTEPQLNSSFAFEDNRVRWPRGKSLGGSSVLNSMIYMRGNPKDFDRWASLTGDREWNYENLLPFFKKLETYEGYFPNDAHHGNDGPVHVEKMRFARGIKEWLKAGQELGYSIRDQNAGQYEGFSTLDVTMKTGTRFDTHRAYLRPVMDRTNLHIQRHALAFKIHLDRQRNAYGVSYYRHGVQKFARANKEIIVSGGTIGSTHLLLLSGIGPKKHLNSKEIKCRVHLPVGENLHDHVVTLVGPYTLEAPLSLLSDRDVSMHSVMEFVTNGTGPLVSSSGISGTAFIASSLAKPSWPDIMLLLVGGGLHHSVGQDQERSLNYKPGILQKYYEPNLGKDANFVTVMVGKPKSRGTITLQDNYPYSQPILDPRYLSHPEDFQVLSDGVRFVNKLYEKTRVYKRVGAKLATNPFPGCENHPFRSEAYWECYIRFNSFTLHHQTGTCRMGRTRDRATVVDAKLRVLKTRRLRVIDASIMPEVTNGNINIPVIMIAERGSFMIRRYWSRQFLVSDKLENFINPKEHRYKCYYSQLV